MCIYRTEHPKPQFERSDWINLNGEWQFETDNGQSGMERGLYRTDYQLGDKINVPFCPESKLSGINNVDFMRGLWYKRNVIIPKEKLSGLTVLHFGAVDYSCVIFVNGEEAGRHKGGYASFSADITRFVTEGENQISVYVSDDSRDPMIPRGKQSESYFSRGCDYTRTTGIWQTVWLEFKPKVFVEKVRYFTDITNGCITVEAFLCGAADLTVSVFYKGRIVGRKTVQSLGGREMLAIELSEIHLWEPGCGRLYDVELTYGEDRVKSYFGMRSLKLDSGRFLINGKSVFQRLVLDQGFYPDGIYTAPSDEALKNDIVLSMKMGFNGARLHQKVFEERYLYHCDRLGYIVWGEYGNWGLDHTSKESLYSILPEWLEIIERDFNHPSIIGWCPYNETWDRNGRVQDDDVIRTVYDVTKAIDRTRPCIDTSGAYHVKTDIFDVHDYEQNPDVFKSHYENLVTNGKIFDAHLKRQTYRGEPLFVSEYGGILWNGNEKGWGYGSAPKTEEEFTERFKGLADALLDNEGIFGLCYTQLTDVEQEQNGLYTYDRKPKFSQKTIRGILSRPAAIEKEN